MSCHDPRIRRQVYLLGHDVGDAVAERVRLALVDIDPRACLHIDRERRQLLVGSPAPAHEVARSLERAGIAVDAWAAEIAA